MKCKVELKEGVSVLATSREHSVTMDLGTPLGDNKGMTPGEMLLNSVAACKIMSYVSLSKSKNIDVKDLVVEISAEIEEAGPLEDTGIQIKAIKTMKTTYRVKSSNSKEEIENFTKLVEKFCTVANALNDKIKGTIEVIIEA
ncbi:OsmC family protein [Clostridium cylindrosporum]|uniref:Putative peroxiredoxin, OsmC-like protein n=1 Tax=Clostridium cylindrosporum DSM 605 TaxID=1121307 RepID=A0A0J8FZN6_CLOCY|nr:OsmC family protein [Clostridium cylindrosporum]KMT21021.1 putative peroxiredoxin, OsmC-like protein [Clostridium cylindrosporum DSM 605]